MKNWIKIERIPAVLASSYEKATNLAVDSYYRPVAEEVVSVFQKGKLMDLGTGPGKLPVEIIKHRPDIFFHDISDLRFIYNDIRLMLF